MSQRFALNAHGRVARYGGASYVYDSRLTDSPVVEVATATVEPAELGAGELLRTRGFMMEPRTLAEIRAYLGEHGFDGDVCDRLCDRRFLQPYESPAEAVERRVLDHFNRRYLPQDEDERPPLYGAGAEYAISPGTFFNLPRDVSSAAAHVGLLGMPIASLRATLGTVAGPALLRLKSRTFCWFDVHRDGVYSELVLPGGRPETLGRGVVLRDCGDIDADAVTLAELFERVRSTLVREFTTPRVRPIVVGGDHAITGPIVSAFLEELPDLGLLHLDAHNDLFYMSHVVYSHAATISNLIRSTGVQCVASYGLRTFADKRMAGVRAIYADATADERIRLRSLTDTKRLVLDERRLEAELDSLAGRPYFLTLDLDVLSDSAIGRRVSTPFGAGLEWHELLTLLDALFRRLDIVGCDVVEYNGLHGDGREAAGNPVTALLMLLADRLAKGNPKPPVAATALAGSALGSR